MLRLRMSIYCLCICFTMIFFIAFIPPGPSHGAFKYVKAGMEVPDFYFSDRDGNHLSLADLKKYPASLVLFWATWSPRSEIALRDAQAIFEQYSAAGLKVVAVNVDRPQVGLRDRSRIEGMVQELGVSVPVVQDVDFAVISALGVVANPSLALLDREGRLVWEASGYFDDTAADCREKIEILLGLREGLSRVDEAELALGQPARKALLNYNLGCSLLRQGRKARALDILESAAAADAGFAAPRILMGHLLLEGGGEDDVLRAEECFRRALQMEPKNASARSGLGESLLRQNRVAEAEAEFEEAVSCDRTFTPALLGLAEACSLQGKEGSAQGLFAEALALSPRDPAVFSRRGASRERSGDFAAAAEDYRRSLEILLDLP